VQSASQTAAGEALNALAVRFSAGNDRLAELVRKDQDLVGEAGKLETALIAAVSVEPSRRDAAKERRIRDRIAAITKERDDLQAVFTRDFPDYAELSKPQPLTLKDIQALLADDEAVVIVDLDAKSYVWGITRSVADWKETAVTADQVSETVSRLRALLNADSREPFDPKLSFALYRQVFGPVESIIGPKARWSLVLNGALTSLPPQVLVTSDPAGQALKDVDWLIRAHAMTVLPSVSSLKVLRSKAAAADAKNPLIGFADPIFERDLPRLQQNSLVMAGLAVARGIRGAIADIAVLRKALPALPETANELKRVAASVKASDADVVLGPDATETRVKQSKLDQYRIVYFATHGLLAGEVSQFAKLNAEPALVLSLPAKPTELDDGLLTASEVAQLKLSADWVVLSACNTAAGDKPGAEALSGLARAFFYAGGRSLLVSHWEVETNSAVALMTGTFAALAANPQLSHGEALRQSMLAMINHPQQPNLVEPKYWAPFVVVGEPAKPTP
jgi:CHAT domain-containing protein